MLLPKNLKLLVRRLFPRLARLRDTQQLRRSFRKSFAERQNRNKISIFGLEPPKVLSGPFQGMIYLNETVWGPIEPKWLGSYEQELHPAINTILGRQYDVIVDVGSAEGYYSVGLAKHFPSTPVFSYDTDPWARAQQKRMARQNGCKNLFVNGLCSIKQLSALVSNKRALIICDIEGDEFNLLDPSRIPGLRNSEILVEVHSNAQLSFDTRKGADFLSHNFSETHAIIEFEVKPRSIPLYESIIADRRGQLADLATILDERRNEDQLWLWMNLKSQ